MRIKRILWVLAAFIFTGVLYVQGGQVATAPAQTREKGKSQAQGPIPMTEKEVMKEIKSGPAESVIKDVKERGVDFDMTPGIEKKLRKAKATDETIEAVRQAGPKVRAQMAKLILGPGPGGVQDIPKEEAMGFAAIKAELNPDKAIGLVDDFVRKYPNSILLSYVYSFGANAYQQKGDVEKVAEYTGKSLKLKPDNLMSLFLSLALLPQPQYLNKHPTDRDKILQEAENEANRALQLIPQIPKQAGEADADYKKRLAGLASEVHSALGMVHLDLASEGLTGWDKAELAKSEQEFTTAVSASEHPDPRDYCRIGEIYDVEGRLDDAIQAYTKASQAGQGTAIKTFADEQVAQLKKRKAQRSAASNPR